MGRFLRGGALYVIFLVIFAVIIVNFIRAGNPNVTELDSQEFQQAINDQAFVISDDESDNNRLLVKDGDQTVTGQLQQSGEDPENFEYPYPQEYDIAGAFNEADIPFYTDPQNTGFWLGLLGTLGPLLIFLLLFLFLMSSMQGSGNRV
ncbi:MAG: cell division protein FtsH, partial [Actinomycetota bacterium]|nr:cell division protein FtsH [Actinomycetota bacterium]